MAELSILNPIILPRVVTEFDAPEQMLGRTLVEVDNDTQPFWEYDIEISDRGKIESYQAHNTEARLIDQLPVGNMKGDYAYTRIKKSFDPSTLRLLRAVGEGSASTAAGEAKVLREMEDMRMKLMRQEEYAIWQMFQGQWTYKEESGISYTIDYKVPAAHKVTKMGQARWGMSSDDPVGDVEAIKRTLLQNSGYPVEYAIMNGKTLSRMYELPEVREFLSDEQKGLYTRERTIARWYEVDWRSYNGGYVTKDAMGNDIYNYYIPDNKIIFFTQSPSYNPFIFKYGPSVDHEAPPGWTGVYTKSWTQPDPSTRFGLMEVQYMPIMTNPLRIAILDIGSTS